MLGNHFIIRTDYKTLKNLLSQVIQTPDQQVFLCKLLGFYYTIEYKPGKENIVADALSRSVECPEETVQEGSILALSRSFCDLLGEIKEENEVNPSIQALIRKIQASSVEVDGFSLMNDHLMRHGRYFVQNTSTKIPLILAEFHCSTLGGHSRIERTLKRISGTFWRKNMKMDVKKFVEVCTV